MREELQRVAQKNGRSIENDVMVHIMSNYSQQMIGAAYAGYASIDMYVPKSSVLFPSYNHSEVLRLVANELKSRQFMVYYDPIIDDEVLIAQWSMAPTSP